MRIEIRNDHIIIDGYVNAVDRFSRPIPSERGKFIEKIEPKAFQRSLEKTDNVDLLLNHDKSRKLGSIKEGNLRLFEDNIGLRAIATISDAEVMEKAKNKQLRGWSFGFYADKDSWAESEGMQKRTIHELDLFEVTIVDDTKTPAYVGTSIETRNNEEVMIENRSVDFEAVTVDESTNQDETTKKDEERSVDLGVYEKEVEILKLKFRK